MRILIVEDETAAYENIVDILAEIDPSVEIIGNTESIIQTIHWLRGNMLPDLILMDIHLSDGSAFSIFESITIEVPIIFTTAYDEYAIEAFRVNCIDYLLKPIKTEELRRALVKFSKWSEREVAQYLSRLTRLSPVSSNNYNDRLLVPHKDKLLPINVCDISCFYTTDKTTTIYMKDGASYPYNKTLDQVMTSLNPCDFTRANKQFIIARDSVRNITVWFDSRLLITLDIETPERIYISKNRAAEFKSWVVGR
ncbi:MAG: LytTR family DNA-binding domain-containing protein [Tannerellaceae bacterium]|jgi:DNA-binding LytR/AlgR family response regulator|nr:LytTR family DNA-binding domain-containing protein [Tannerellaceae bacterium]